MTEIRALKTVLDLAIDSACGCPSVSETNGKQFNGYLNHHKSCAVHHSKPELEIVRKLIERMERKGSR